MPTFTSLIIVIAATLYVMDRASSYANGKSLWFGAAVMLGSFTVFLCTFQASLALLS